MWRRVVPRTWRGIARTCAVCGSGRRRRRHARVHGNGMGRGRGFIAFSTRRNGCAVARRTHLRAVTPPTALLTPTPVMTPSTPTTPGTTTVPSRTPDRCIPTNRRSSSRRPFPRPAATATAVDPVVLTPNARSPPAAQRTSTSHTCHLGPTIGSLGQPTRFPRAPPLTTTQARNLPRRVESGPCLGLQTRA